MNIIKLKVNNFEIIPEEKSYVIENQVNEFALEFEFDDTWNYETKYVVFDNEESTYKRPIINNQVIIPSELLNGRTTIQIYAQDVENNEIVKRKPSFKYSFSILNSLSPEGIEETDLPTPSQWEIYISQIEEMCDDLQDQFDDLKEECEAKCDDVIERLTQDEQDIQTNTDNIRTNAEAIDKLNTDLLDYSLITETGNKISMSINPNTYIITLSLKDKNDNVLSTQSVDLPLETMIVSASYSNGVLTFTLKNGQTLQVPIGDLISGLVSTDTFNQAVQGLSNRITTIENDYLKSTDKTELQNQITANADDIDNIQEEQLTQNADIEELQQENERLSRIVSGLPTKNASGTNVILNDMVNCEIKEVSLKGDVLQISDNKMITTNQNYYINSTATAYGKGADNTGVAIPIIPGATYTIKATATLSRYRIGTTNTLEDSGSLSNGAIYDNTSTTATITSNDSYLIINVNDLTKIYITTNTPTPESPIEIQTVTGNQTIQFSGKNLLDTISSSVEVAGVTITPQNDGGLKITGTSTASFNRTIVNQSNPPLVRNNDYIRSVKTVGTINKNGKYVFLTGRDSNNVNAMGDLSINGNETTTRVTSIEGQYLMTSINIYCSDAGVEFNCTIYPQLEIGSTATTFEKYNGTTFPISLGSIELCKIGDYQDKIYKQNDKWYLEKNIGKIILNGSENWSRQNQGLGYLWVFSNDRNTSVYNGYCDRFSVEQSSSTWTELNYCGWSSSNNFWVREDNQIASTLDEWKEWLRTHNLNVYYVLATPTITEITDENLISQLEALNNYILLTNNTIISNGNLPVINDITGYVDIMSLLSTQNNRSVDNKKGGETKEEPIEEPIEEPKEEEK